MSAEPLDLAVLLSGGGRTLQNLIDEIEGGRLRARIRIVISSSRNSGGLERARRHDLPVEAVNRKTFPSDRAFSVAITKALSPFPVDYVLLAGFMHLYLFPPEYEGKVLNIHPALLPKFGGRGFFGDRVHRAVLRAGETESGCTVHYANHHYDQGPLILQERVPVLPEDTVATLAQRVFEAECRAFPGALRKLAKKKAGGLS